MVTSSNIKALLSTTQSWWICPVTGTKIPSTDVDAIEKHKTALLAKHEEQEHQKKIRKALTANQRALAKVQTFSQFKVWFLERMQIVMADNTLTEKDLPTFQPIELSKTNKRYVSSMSVYLEVIGGPSKQVKKFRERMGIQAPPTWMKSICDAKFVFPLNMSCDFFRSFALAYTRQQNATKLSKEAKEQLYRENKEYAKDIDELASLAAEIHALRERARVISLRCERARSSKPANLLDSL